jgi:hypothetical protein
MWFVECDYVIEQVPATDCDERQLPINGSLLRSMVLHDSSSNAQLRPVGARTNDLYLPNDHSAQPRRPSLPGPD